MPSEQDLGKTWLRKIWLFVVVSAWVQAIWRENSYGGQIRLDLDTNRHSH